MATTVKDGWAAYPEMQPEDNVLCVVATNKGRVELSRFIANPASKGFLRMLPSGMPAMYKDGEEQVVVFLPIPPMTPEMAAMLLSGGRGATSNFKLELLKGRLMPPFFNVDF